jgi:AraC family transcriptional regulator, L-rhamnose operon regulatory protein RhaS
MPRDFPGCLEVYVARDERGERAGLGLNGSKNLLDEVPIVGWATVATAQRYDGVPAHTHDAYEIMYVTHGSSEWWVGDSVYELTPGHVYLTKPGERHGLMNAIYTPSEYYWLQVQFDVEKHIPGLAREEAQSLSRDLDAIQHRCFVASSGIRECFQHLLQEHRSPGPYSTTIARSTLHALLIHLIRDHRWHSNRLKLKHAEQSALIREAMDRIDRRLDEPLLALKFVRNRGLSNRVFHQKFLAEVGWTPVEYRSRRRIQQAKLMLRQKPLSVTQIALSLGFGTSQYFATVFKKTTGITPREYRAQILRNEVRER